MNKTNTTYSKLAKPWSMLFSRFILFAGIQALFALAFSLTGSANAWDTSANWWPLIVAIANMISVGLLISLFNNEGKSYKDIFRIQRGHLKNDLLALLVITIISAPVTYFPNILLGKWLFGDPNATLNLIVRQLPNWAAYASIFFVPDHTGYG